MSVSAIEERVEPKHGFTQPCFVRFGQNWVALRAATWQAIEPVTHHLCACRQEKAVDRLDVRQHSEMSVANQSARGRSNSSVRYGKVHV